MLDQSAHHCRRQQAGGRPPAGDIVQPGRRVEARMQPHHTAGGQCRQHLDRQPAHVEKRQHGQHARAAVHALRVDGGVQVGGQAGLSVQGALGCAGLRPCRCRLAAGRRHAQGLQPRRGGLHLGGEPAARPGSTLGLEHRRIDKPALLPAIAHCRCSGR